MAEKSVLKTGRNPLGPKAAALRHTIETKQMNASKTIFKDLARLAVRYGWPSTEIEKIKGEIASSPYEMARYWRNLAIARCAGYSQTPENGFLSLPEWCKQNGWPDPTSNDFAHGTIHFRHKGK